MKKQNPALKKTHLKQTDSSMAKFYETQVWFTILADNWNGGQK